MNEKSRNPLEKRSSSTRAKKVDYAALHEIKIEEVDCDDDFDDTEPKVIAPTSPPKKKRKTHQSAKESEIVTDEKCGLCSGCRRKPCSECSFCNSGDFGQCIDLYCMNQKEGRSQREAAREAYLMSLGKARLHEEQDSVEDDIEEEDKPKNDLSVKQQIDLIMEEIGAAQKNRSKQGVKKPNSTGFVSPQSDPSRSKVQKSPNKSNSAKSDTQAEKKDPLKQTKAYAQHGVYGGSSSAAKSRRCGECEGCMRDDCGQCVPCADKPRFGGPGTKKKACVQRFCRTRKLEEDHAQANFPLNSADALKAPRPVSKLGSKKSSGSITDHFKIKPKTEKVVEVEVILPASDESSSEVVGQDELIEDEFATNDDNIEEPEMIEDELIEDEFANEEEEDAILQD